MSRLREKMSRDFPGWQWDDGPIFVGEDGRKWAIQCGRATRFLEELAQLAGMQYQSKCVKATIQQLKEMQDMEKRLDAE